MIEFLAKMGEFLRNLQGISEVWNVPTIPSADVETLQAGLTDVMLEKKYVTRWYRIDLAHDVLPV